MMVGVLGVCLNAQVYVFGDVREENWFAVVPIHRVYFASSVSFGPDLSHVDNIIPESVED
jgi:hypothetical protein